MKATKLIELLQDIVEQEGDLQVGAHGRLVTGFWYEDRVLRKGRERYVRLLTAAGGERGESDDVASSPK